MTLGRETKILLALLGTLSSGLVGVLGSKLFVPRPPDGAGPDVHLPARDHEDGPIVEPPSFDRLERSMFSATESPSAGGDPADDLPGDDGGSGSLLEPPTFADADATIDDAGSRFGGPAGEESVGFPRNQSFGMADDGLAADPLADAAIGPDADSNDGMLADAMIAEDGTRAAEDASAGDDVGSSAAFDEPAVFADDRFGDPLAAEPPSFAGGQPGGTGFGGADAVEPPGRFAPPVDAMPISSGGHVVVAGDTWWSIAERAYGDGRLYKPLFAWNRAIDPRVSLAPGTTLEVPPLNSLATAHAGLVPNELAAAAPASGLVQASAVVPVEQPGFGGAAVVGANTVVVRPGDTLISIAREQLGSSARWRELYEANREQLGRSPGPLTPGTQLVLP